MRDVSKSSVDASPRADVRARKATAASATSGHTLLASTISNVNTSTSTHNSERGSLRGGDSPGPSSVRWSAAAAQLAVDPQRLEHYSPERSSEAAGAGAEDRDPLDARRSIKSIGCCSPDDPTICEFSNKHEVPARFFEITFICINWSYE